MEPRTIFLLYLLAGVSADFTADCPSACQCGWDKGNKQAKCANAGFTSIPETLSTDVQKLDLTGNPLGDIKRRAFEHVGIMNLKTLVLEGCNLTRIDKDAFKGLGIVIVIDISNNQLSTLHPDTFKETKRLRHLFVNNNQIEHLDAIFNGLQYLRYIDLSRNKIAHIADNTFDNLPRLVSLSLDHNKLEYLNLASHNWTHVDNFYINDNPWRCDCHLRPFIDWVIRLRFDTTACAEPTELQGKLWKDLDTSSLTCPPVTSAPSRTYTNNRIG